MRSTMVGSNLQQFLRLPLAIPHLLVTLQCSSGFLTRSDALGKHRMLCLVNHRQFPTLHHPVVAFLVQDDSLCKVPFNMPSQSAGND